MKTSFESDRVVGELWRRDARVHSNLDQNIKGDLRELRL